MSRVELNWARLADGAWCDLYALDLASPAFDGLEGVFVAWRGGATPETLAVGGGLVRSQFQALARDQRIAAHRKDGVFVTWAAVDHALRDGAVRFLCDALQPRVRPPGLTAAPVEISLPGQGGAAVAVSAVNYEELKARPGDAPNGLPARDVDLVVPTPRAETPAPVVEQPKVRTLTALQKGFDDLVNNARGSKGGLFGGAKAGKPEEEVVVAAMQLILKEAVGAGASDIHLEPQLECLRVRLRIDGLLEEFLQVPHALNLRLVSHVRVSCGLDPEKGVGNAKPEDARMAVKVLGQEADLRVSTFPTAHGDKVVLRVIPRKQSAPKLEELGLRSSSVELLSQWMNRPQGMIVVTGPTGSGKSTTLYTMLQALNRPSRNIVTLEDPIELRIPGINQGVLAPKAGFNFAEGLRAILRQDPNVIMVGEIRDSETAQIALSAALTGHLLLTSLHTTNALGAIARLIDMGLEPFLIASSLTGVCAQRLARRVCEKCREGYEPTASERAEIEALGVRNGVKISGASIKQLFRGRGCEACRGSGYRGRMLLFEAVSVSPKLRQLVLAKANAEELRRVATAEGQESLLLDGLGKAATGHTTVAELMRVVGSGDS